MASTLAFLILFFLRAVSEPEPQTTSFSFSNFDQDTNFQSNIAISRDSKVINGGSAIQLAGKAIYKKSVQILQGNPPNLVSFSTNFSFSLSGGIGDGLAFVMAPISANLSKLGALDGILSVEFETSKEAEMDHVREAQVEVNLGSMVTVGINNASSLVSYTGQRLYCWIDYEAGSRVLEVRLTELGDQRPQNPILLHQLDLTKTWKDREVHTGLSSNGVCFIYSWSFRLRKVPHWMHSQPLDPSAVSKEVDNPSVREKKKCNCVLKLLATSIFATASVALGSVLVLYVCAMFGSRRRTVVKTLDCEYKKVEVFVADKVIKDGL